MAVLNDRFVAVHLQVSPWEASLPGLGTRWPAGDEEYHKPENQTGSLPRQQAPPHSRGNSVWAGEWRGIGLIHSWLIRY